MNQSMTSSFGEVYGSNLCHGKSILDGNCASSFNFQRIRGYSSLGLFTFKGASEKLVLSHNWANPENSETSREKRPGVSRCLYR
jgi:hypothetical protein